LFNTAGTGGGVCALGPATITNCIFVGNLVEHDEYGGLGGGLAICGTGAATIVNCVIIDCESQNLGGAVYVDEDSSASFINCTLAGNQALDGSGVYSADNGLATIVNSIISHGVDGGAAAGSGDIQISYSDVFGNAGGDWIGPIANQQGIQGNISEAPLFVAPGAFDVHLSRNSPCRDSGDSSCAGLPAEDCEGDPRIAGGQIDMGADEFYYHLYHTGDAIPGGTVEIKIVGYFQAPVTLGWGLAIIDPPFPTPHGDLYIWPIARWCFIGNIPPSGVLSIPVTLSSNWQSGDHAPLQAMVGPWGGTWTTLTNLDDVTVE